MRKSVTFLLIFFLALKLHAQAPQAFDFQGVARNAMGEVIANTKISLRLTIRPTTALGPIVYQEKHEPTTSSSGIFTVACGEGVTLGGSFTDIDWKAESKYFLQVEIDVAGGNAYSNLGATQILSVPYALHAAEAIEADHAIAADYVFEAKRWVNDEPVVQSGILDKGSDYPDLSIGTHLVWYPKQGAFRAGTVYGSTWNVSKVGTGSVAFGTNTEASAWSAIAAGHTTIASGEMSTAFGAHSQALGHAAVALGSYTEALAGASVAIGASVIAKAICGIAIGVSNDDQDNPSTVFSQPSDRLFQIGNGTNSENGRSNAVTILKNGNFGIGSTVLEPKFILDIGERPRIRHNTTSSNGNSAGIFFDDSKGSPEGFVGMKANDQIGFYNDSKWLFWMDNAGNANIMGSNYNTSDRRLKRNFTSLSSSLSKLSDLNGYHYFWKDSTLDQTLQTGLIAQEVETHFPELVKTDDKGFKSVNYTGLIPHLIESVKELKASVEYLQNLNKDMRAENDVLKAQADDIKDLRKEFTMLLNAVKNSAADVSANAKPNHTSFQPNRSDK